MGFGDRLGLIGLILFFIGLAITILWPTKRWIGWLSVAMAALLCLGWGAREWRQRSTKANESTNVSMTLPSSPLSGFQISKTLLRASVKVDTKYMLQFKDGFDILIILRVIDNSVEALNDTRLNKSAAFEITGDVRTIEINLTKEFFDRADKSGKLGGGNVGLNLVLIPKSVKPDQIVTLRDVTRLGGMQTTLDHGLQEQANPY